MISKGEKLSLTLSIFQKMTNISWDGGEIEGNIVLTQEINEIIFQLEIHNLIYPTIKLADRELTITELKSDGIVNRECKIKLHPPRFSNGSLFFAKDLDDLFSITRYQFEEPDQYFIARYNFQKGQKNIPPEINKYVQIVKLITLLKDICDHHEIKSGQLRLIFLCKNKLELPIQYNIDDTNQINNLDSLIHGLKSEPHNDQKVEIFRSVLFEVLININSNERFKHLLFCFEDLLKRFKDNYQLFLSEFSFEKIREEIEERNLEFTSKLNKIFSEIQNKILTIPIALVIIGSQFENENKITLKNTLILFGAIVFSTLMFILLSNQNQSLRAIKDSLEAQRERFRLKYASLFDEFENTYDKLEKRYKKQLIFLKGIFVIVLVSLILTLIIYIYYSPEIINIFNFISTDNT